MKKVIQFLSAASLCALFAIGTNSCGKEGPQSEQGLQGIQGIKGDDGNTLYSGTVAPPANLGNAGDFYLHTSKSNFYGPKTADGWGTPISLRDATEVTGVAQIPGTRILSGTVESTASIGAMADYSLITTR